MVFCCFQWPGPDHSSDPAGKVGSNLYVPSTYYPGQRPTTYYPTIGNALSDRPLSNPAVSYGDNVPSNNSVGASQDLVSVCVPPGVSPGQTIRILHPDGSGRQIEAQVPLGMAVGSTFYVQASRIDKPSSVVNETAIAFPSAYDETTAMAHPLGDYTDVPPVSSTVTHSPPAAHARPFSECLDNPVPQSIGQPLLLNSSNTNGSIRQQTSPSSSQKLLKVTVPPGTAPGRTIHVQVPGENYLIAAQVPPNCSEFHVQYDPISSTQFPPQQHTNTYGSVDFVSHHQNQPETRSVPDSNHKLLLVRVPPGTSPGTKLVVQIPDEPGRMLSAEVPPGNIREFQVAYEPSPYSYRSSSPAVPIHSDHGPVYGDPSTTEWNQHQNFRRQQNQRQQHDHNQQQHPWNTRSTNNSNNRRDSRSENAEWLMSTAGGFAAGVASAMVYDHFVNNDN